MTEEKKEKKKNKSKFEEDLDGFIEEITLKVRVKTGDFIARFSRQDLSRGLSKPGKHRFYRLEMPYEEALAKLDQIKSKLDNNPLSSSITIRNYNIENDLYNFQQLYNIIFLTSPDPTREISVEDAKGFPEERTFLAEFYGSLVGFIYLTIEQDPLVKEKTYHPVGAVAGIGVLSKHRGKKIGLKLLKTAIEFFKDKNVEKLICEVYEQNGASLRMFEGLGMKKVGIMILEEEQPNLE